MRLTTIIASLTLLSLPAISQTLTTSATSTETDFKVEQIEPTKLVALKAADAELSKATAALVAAQGVVQAAKDKYDAISYSIMSGYAVMQGSCETPGGISLSGTRTYRRVDIRGSYVLISSGHEVCYPTTGLASIVGSGTTWIAK